MLGRWWSVDDGRLIARRLVDSFVGRSIDNDDTEMSELMAAGDEYIMIFYVVLTISCGSVLRRFSCI